MTYRVSLTRAAHRQLNALPYATAAAIGMLLDQLEINPHRMGGELHGRWAGYRSARRGPYRVIYRIHEEEVHVLVFRIGRRADVYRPR